MRPVARSVFRLEASFSSANFWLRGEGVVRLYVSRGGAAHLEGGDTHLPMKMWVQPCSLVWKVSTPSRSGAAAGVSTSILTETGLTCFRGVEEEALEDLGRHPRLGVRLGLDVALGLPGVLYCILCVL